MRVSGPALTADVDLARGAKITSLRDASNVEWLAQTDEVSRVGPETSFVDAEMAGWDECAPSIVECAVAEFSIPDHGDLWNCPFTPGDAPGSAWAVGSSLGYRFERTISATERGLRLDYAAEAISTPVPFLWAAHPQFVVSPGTIVELGDPSVTVPVVDVLDASLPESEWRHDVPVLAGVDQRGCGKYYVRPDHWIDSVTLRRPTGESLTCRWSAECRYVGIWIDNGLYSREPVIAIEPSTGYFDSLATAVSNGTAVTLVPGAPFRWWVELEAPVRSSALVVSEQVM